MRDDNVVLVTGTSGAGKTTFIAERLLPALVARGYSVGVIKDIHIEGFCIDQEGKDTWRHAKAGASIVVARGLDETDILFQRRMDLEDILPSLDSVDLVLAEGFKEEHGRKIIIARDEAEYDEMKVLVTGDDEVLGVAGPVVDTGITDDAYPLINNDDDLAALVDKLEPLAKRARLRRNRLKMPLEALACTSIIDDVPLLMKDYVAETLKNVAIGTIAALHWNLHDFVSSIAIALARSDASTNWSLAIRINDKDIEMKEFVQKSIAGTILGYLASLRLPDETILATCTTIAIDIK